jgi:DNA-binding response OmpR family regulator
MFNADPRQLQRIAPLIERVLIIDPNPLAGKLLTELVREMGARQTAYCSDTERAFEVADQFAPLLIFTEYMVEKVDGIDFTTRLRRARFSARRAPVIMLTAEATANSITGARNAGVHEFLRKPYTAGELFRRVENVALKPRPWIEAKMYVGPDRRRFNSEDYAGARKRRADMTVSIGAMSRAG